MKFVIGAIFILTSALAHSQLSVTDWIYLEDIEEYPSALGYSLMLTGHDPSQRQPNEIEYFGEEEVITYKVSKSVETYLANPYNSVMDTYNFIHDVQNSKNITGTIYYKAITDENIGTEDLAGLKAGYATYTISLDGSVESFTRTHQKLPMDHRYVGGKERNLKDGSYNNRYIPVKQNFIVVGTQNGTIETSSDHLAQYIDLQNATNVQPIKDSEDHGNNVAKLADDLQRIKLYVGFDEISTSELMLNFHPSFTEKFDYGLESESLEGDASDAYFTSEGKPMVVKALQFYESMRIPLVLNLRQTIDVKVRLADMENFNHFQKVFLHDNKTDEYYNLKNTDFSIENMAAGVYKERFSLVFTDNTLGYKSTVATDLKVFVDNQQGTINILNPNLKQVVDLKLYDLKGKAFIDQENIAVYDKYQFNTRSLSTGVYVLAMKLANNEKLNQKLVIKKIR